MGKRVDSNSIGQDADRSRVIFLLNRLQTLYLQKPRTDSGTGFFLLNGNSYHSMRLRMNRQYSAKFIFDVQVYVSAVWPEYRPGDHQRGRETGKFAKFRSRSNRLETKARLVWRIRRVQQDFSSNFDALVSSNGYNYIKKEFIIAILISFEY